MSYYENLAAIIPWKSCNIIGCPKTTNYNGWHIHKHSITSDSFQIWTLSHEAYKTLHTNLTEILKAIDEGTI